MAEILLYSYVMFRYDNHFCSYPVIIINEVNALKNMFEINPIKNQIQDLAERTAVLRGYL